jgi:2'-5' RNA ligase
VEELLRTFFAVEIGDAARNVARDVARRLAREPGGDAVRWTRPEAYHVTLRFLGPTRREQVPGLVAAVRDAARQAAPFALGLGALNGFPAPRRARVVVVDVEPAAPVAALAAAVERAVVGEGFAPEARAFHPHVTLGRLRDRARRAPLLDPSLGPEEAAPFDVASVVLFESTTGRDGARYTPLERIPLGGAFSP